HGYWHLAMLAATAAGLAAGVLAVACGAATALHRDAPARAPVRATDVIVTQVGVFAGLELLERVAAGLSPTVLLHERAVAFGVLLQVVVGAVVAAALAALHRAAHHAAVLLGRHPRRRPVSSRPWRATIVTVAASAG